MRVLTRNLVYGFFGPGLNPPPPRRKHFDTSRFLHCQLPSFGLVWAPVFRNVPRSVFTIIPSIKNICLYSDSCRKSLIGQHIPTPQYCVHTRKFTAAPAGRSGIVRQWFIPVDVAWEFDRAETKEPEHHCTVLRKGICVSLGPKKDLEEIGKDAGWLEVWDMKMGWDQRIKGGRIREVVAATGSHPVADRACGNQWLWLIRWLPCCCRVYLLAPVHHGESHPGVQNVLYSTPQTHYGGIGADVLVSNRTILFCRSWARMVQRDVS
ncbi:hypothetical protein K438DRAFT_1768449 [Mycena galopus ATCC 62051]|nr:hypothetical protein K438DRAFT_1768449 [Mycena galopus ATCC 62051]